MSKRQVMSPIWVSFRVQGPSRRLVQAEPNGRKGNSDDGDNASKASSKPSRSPLPSPSSKDAASISSSANSARSDSSSDSKVLQEEERDRSTMKDSPSLEVPKLTGADNYELWRTMNELKIKVQKLWSLVTEEVVQNSSWSSAKKR
ncbi:hypothetical protein L915_14962 [Phytophthora nicotianae]|uniref:Uncharacterized protein n=1 Tax=Phytophthora nicotianae TaxID=4792 RepID=W2IGU9_PHYNI|nr:hypothetical protein L915_14962 [Phytophthora nicotianae]ETL32578.1 hypothetical protein L916_14864 [Phytophthora nicotianae]